MGDDNNKEDVVLSALGKINKKISEKILMPEVKSLLDVIKSDLEQLYDIAYTKGRNDALSSVEKPLQDFMNSFNIKSK